MVFGVSFIIFWLILIISFYLAIWSGFYSILLVFVISIAIVIGIYFLFYTLFKRFLGVDELKNIYSAISIRKFKPGSPITIIFVLIPILLIIYYAFHFRFDYAISNLPLPQVDPYGHFFHTKQLMIGELTGDVKYYNDYPKGFHALTAMVSIITGLETYAVYRFVGPCISVLTVVYVFILLSRWRNVNADLIGSMVAAGFTFNKSTTEFTERGILSTPEIGAFLILVIWLYLAFFGFRNIFNNPKGGRRTSSVYVILIIIPIILILLVHPYSGIFMGVSALIMLLSTLLFPFKEAKESTKKRLLRAIILILIILPILILPPLIWITVTDSPWLDSIWTLFSIKQWEISSYQWSMAILIALYTAYSVYIKNSWNVFIGAMGLMYFFIAVTGFLLPEYLPYSRALPYVGLIYILLFATAMGTLLGFPRRLCEKVISSYKNKMKYCFRIGSVLCILVLIILAAYNTPSSTPGTPPFGSEEGVRVALEIVEEYEDDGVLVYSDKLFLVNLEQSIVEPKLEHRELELLLEENSTTYRPAKTVFIFVDVFIDAQNQAFGDPFSFTTTTLAIEVIGWLDKYSTTHQVIEYHREASLRVYLITPYE
jgi:hypothetical protein